MQVKLHWHMAHLALFIYCHSKTLCDLWSVYSHSNSLCINYIPSSSNFPFCGYEVIAVVIYDEPMMKPIV